MRFQSFFIFTLCEKQSDIKFTPREHIPNGSYFFTLLWSFHSRAPLATTPFARLQCAREIYSEFLPSHFYHISAAKKSREGKLKNYSHETIPGKVMNIFSTRNHEIFIVGKWFSGNRTARTEKKNFARL